MRAPAAFRPFSPSPSADRAPAAAEGVADLAAPRLTGLDRAFLGLLALMVALHIIAAALAAGWPTAAATDLIAAVYLFALATRRAWRPLLARLFVLGLVAGALELFTDAAGESFAHSLVYPPAQPMLWASPIYMPLSWAIVLTQLGYLGWRLAGLAPRLPLALAVSLTGLAGAAIVPFYEEMAYYAGWWHYAAAPHLGHTPLYVLLFEGAVAASLPIVTRALPRLPLSRAALAGMVVGVWMPCAALLSWLAIGR
jgi:uncharacterized protein DUF6989